jgi:hypothetical protein
MKRRSKTKLAKKSLTKKKATLKKAAAHKRQVQRESQSVDTWHSRRRDREHGREGNRAICRGYPMSKVRIQRVWTSCSKKETRSRPTW